MYFGTDYNDVSDANRDNPLGVLVSEGQIELSSDPYDPITLEPSLQKDTTYYWRIDDLDDSDKVIFTGDVWSFTTWETEPWVISRFISAGDIIFELGSNISLIRSFGSYNLVVDSVVVPPELLDEVDGTKSYKRDVGAHRWIKRLWSPVDYSPPPPPEPIRTLGNSDGHNFDGDTEPIQVRFGRFNNVGEIGQVFSQNVYDWLWGEGTTEFLVRLDLAHPDFQQLFKYLTKFDPTSDRIDNDGDGVGKDDEIDNDELKIPGRININTAPWYVIAQLPWVSQKLGQTLNYQLAQAIVAAREQNGGFRSIGQLNNVVNAADPKSSIDYYWRKADPAAAGDQRGFPDLNNSRRTLKDGAVNDFEERDLIFSRISDLVTVRSDVFTAYILVRIGPDGPQKRVIAILDRSGVYPDGPGGEIGRVKIVALHPVPDPR
ncbi:hypothetical protein ES703_89611 [subsurface metagenome]